MKRRVLRLLILLAFVFVFVLAIMPLLFKASFVYAQSSNLSVTPLTWNVIGLDSNSPTDGPQYFPIGAEVCNTSGGTLTNVVVDFIWDDTVSTSPHINLRTASANQITIPNLANGTCYDAYFEVEVNQVSAAYDNARGYYIQATGGGEVVTTPQPAELYVEYLISQNRNSTDNVFYALDNGDPLIGVPPGGEMNLVVDETYIIELEGSTATQGYEQLESFLTLPNTIFQINSVSTTYTANTSMGNVPALNPSLYADACNWENDVNSPNYRSCLQSSLKAGGGVTTTYNVTIISGGGTSQTLNSLLYDFSGSSFHYNSDYSTGFRIANIIDPSTADISKQFIPSTISDGGVSTLIITLTNPNGGTLSGYNFTDPLPTNMTVANPTNANTSGCGSPTFNPTPGATSLSFTGGTVAANGSCTISVSVTAPLTTASPQDYVNTTNNLFVGTTDTTNFATATLTVTDQPTPPACIPNQPLVTWSFNSGFNINAPEADATPAVMVSAQAGAGLTPSEGADLQGPGTESWTSDNIDNSGSLNTALNQYFEFTIDTTGLSEVDISFWAIRTPQGPASVKLIYGPTGTENTSVGAFTITQTSTQFSATNLVTDINTTGNTIFRLYVYNANNNSNGHAISIDAVTFSGCLVPNPPTLAKTFSPNPIGVNGVSTLTFTLTNPNSSVALTGATFSDTLPTGLQVASPANVSSTCAGATWSSAVGATTLNFSTGTIPAGGSCTAQVDIIGTNAGPYTNISGFISTTESGENSTSTGSATATLSVLAPPEISKLFSPNPILENGISTLTFTILNPNQNDAIDAVAFSDTFPAGMIVAGTPNENSTCGGIFTPTAGAGSVTLTGGGIVAGGNCTLSVDVTAPTIGSYANTTSNVSHQVNGITFNGNTASDTLVVEAPSPAIVILKQVSTTATGPWLDYVAIAPGADVYYQITIENAGDVPLDNPTVTDPNVNTAGCIWTNPLPVADALDDDHIDTCVIGPVTGVAGSNVNTATANATYSAIPVTASDDSATYATASLDMVKAATPTTYTTSGQTISYTFTVTNNGAATLSGPISITDPLITVTCPSVNTVGNLDNFFNPTEAVVCTGTYMITGADVTAGSVTNTASASAPTTSAPGAAVITSPDDSVTITTPNADLSLTKSVDNATPNVGDSIVFTITVTNAGADTATNVTVSDLLPSGFTYVSDDGGGAYVNGTGVWTIGSIANGASATLNITATVNATGIYTNVAQITNSDQADPDSTPNNDDGDQSEDDEANAVVTPTSADLSLTKSVDNATPNVGDSIVFTITVSNAGADTATNVTVSDLLPNGFTYVSDDGGGAYVNGTGVWTIGGIANGASASLNITATVNASGTYTNVAQVTNSDQADPDSTPNNDDGDQSEDDEANAVVTPTSADLSLTKSVDNATPNVGDSIVFTITVSNAGADTATNITVSDLLPNGFTYVSDDGGGAYVNGTGVWTISSIANGASASLNITATVNASGTYTNVAQVTNSDQADPDSTPNNDDGDQSEDDEANAVVTPTSADLSLTKSVDNATPNVGDSIVFAITVSNAGADTATNVTVSDLLPSGFTYVSDDGGGAYVNGTGVWTIGSIANGASATLNITATVNATGIYTNVAQITNSDQADPDSTPNNDDGDQSEDDEANVVVTPVGAPVIEATKADTLQVDGGGNGLVDPGDTIRYTIIIENTGTDDATTVTFTDTPDANTALVVGSVTTSQGTVTTGNTGGDTTVAVDIGTITSAGTVTITFDVVVDNPLPPAVTVVANQGTVSGGNFTDLPTDDPDTPTTDDPTETSINLPEADLSLTKTVDNATPAIGTGVIFTVTVSNAGPDDASNVTVTDQLPAGYTYVSDDGGGAYNSATGIWTIGGIANGESATLNITATVNASGTYTNVAQVTNSDQADPDSTPNNDDGDQSEDDEANAVVTPTSADLSLTKSVDNATPNVGDSIVFTITVSNAGADTATNITVSDLLPSGFTYVSDDGGGAYVNGTGVWTIGSIANGASASLNITATVNASGTYTNVAQITNSDQADPDSTPNNDDGDQSEDDEANVVVTPTSADLSLTKSVDNATPNVGDSIVFTITVSNAGADTATNVTVIDLLPSGFTYVSDDGGGAYVNGTGVWTIGSIANGASASLNITATVNASGTYTNVAQITNSDQADPDSIPNNDDGDQSEDDEANVVVTPVGAPVIEATKTDALQVDGGGNGLVDPGDTIRYTIIIENTSTDDATTVTFTDTPDANTALVVGSVTTSQGTVTTGNTGGDTTVAVDIGTITSAGTVTITFDVVVDNPLPPAVTVVANQGTVSGGNFTDLPTDDPDTPTTDDPTETSINLPEADLSLTKTVDNATPAIGTDVVFTVTVSNAGPDDASNVTVTDQLPAGYTYVSDDGGGAYNSATGIWTIGGIANGASATVNITATVNDVGPYDNVVEVTTSDQGDPDSAPNNDDGDQSEDDEDGITPVPVGTPLINANKVDALQLDNNGNGLVDPGDTLRYTVTINNIGSGDATTVAFTDTPDANTALVVGSVTTTQGTITIGNIGGDTTVAVDIGTITPVATIAITYDVVVVDALPASVTSVANQGIVSGGNIPNTSTNDPDTATGDDPTQTPINQPPIVQPTVQSTDTPASPLIILFDPAISKIGFLEQDELGLQNEVITWYVTVINNGNLTGNNIVVSDTLRTELRVDDVIAPASITVTTVGQTVTATIPTLAPGESVNFQIVTTVIGGGAEVDNTACLTSDDIDGTRCITADAIRTLPNTGETPWWRNVLIGVLTVTFLVTASKVIHRRLTLRS